MSENNSSNNDELVSQFMSFTGSADPERAASYLEMSGGDLETAVSLFMEHETGTDNGGGGGAAGGGGGGMTGDDVRAPDATRTMRLMDDHAGMGMFETMMGDTAMHLMNAMMEEQLAQSAFGAFGGGVAAAAAGGRVNPRAAINAAVAAADDAEDDDNDSYEMKEDDDDDDEVQVVGAPEPPRLSDMFAPPTHLMHKTGGFQGARAMAKDSKRWLLVNIQSDKEFSSHALNRDVWRDELVENLIREGFIFWQAMDESPDGRTFMERYQVNVLPHISIIDPRTGRLMWRKEGWTQQNPVTVENFAEMAMDFCSRNSFDRPPQAPRLAAAAASAPAVRSPTQKRPMNEMSEDEQLEAAMRASIEEAMGGDGGEAPPAATATGGGSIDDAIDVEDLKPAAQEVPKEPSLIDELLAFAVGDEPATGARMQIKMPDGKKLTRKFSESDSVKAIYALVAQSVEEARGGRPFSVMAGYPPNELINHIDSSIGECKLSGEMITVRWQA